MLSDNFKLFNVLFAKKSYLTSSFKVINRKKLQFEIISKKLTYPKAGRKDTFLWNFLLCLLYDYSES
ncbi:hypothetical protein FH036_02770 [Bacillus sp. CD3-5]|nr:hypothetical protein FH036_02770 [Bacillus sp. CD3-5]